MRITPYRPHLASLLLIPLFTVTVWCEDRYPTLHVGDQTFTNVTITGSTPTVLYIQHAGGLGSLRLKDLPVELQSKYGFDAAKAATIETQQKEAHRDFAQALAKQPAPKPDAPTSATPPHSGDKSARSYLNQPAPPLHVTSWIGSTPEVQGKFLLVDFWATWCGPCRKSIPHLNAIHAKYGDRLIVLGLSDEPEEKVTAMKEPTIEYYSAVDPARRTSQAMELRAIPHALLIDPQGIVRYQGHPAALSDQAIEFILERFGRQ